MTTLVNLTHAGPPVWFSFTGSGTLGDPFVISGAASFPVQIANTVFAGPTTGADAAPTFRSLVTADMPAYVMATATLLYSPTGLSL